MTGLLTLSQRDDIKAAECMIAFAFKKYDFKAFDLPPDNIRGTLDRLRILAQPSYLVPAYMTRNERDVRIFARDGGGPFPVMGAFADRDRWLMSRWSESLANGAGRPELDLVAAISGAQQ